jgi:RHS repeat-associated protein
LEDQGANNYTYDEIGNLKSDAYENISHIEWNVYGKIHEINKLSSPLSNSIYVKYFYDPSGNRIGKTEEYAQADAHFNWFVRDAQGNIMATYQVIGGWGGQGPLLLKDHHVYGSERLGIIKRDWDMQQDKYSSVNANLIGPTYVVNLARGNKLFELSNHLSNNLVVISDKKAGVSGNGTTVDYYNADVVNAQDYYPFGFVMPNRKFSVTSKLPTFTFNGKMNDREVKGDGLQLDYGFRVYDPRCGCFLSVDPLTKDYPFYTPYQFAGNKPIYALDLDGAEELPYVDQYKYDGSWGWFDRLKAVPNAAGRAYNGLIVDTWNSGVANVRGIGRGTWAKDVANDASLVWNGIKNEAVATYNYHTATAAGQQVKDFGNYLLQPERIEDALLFYGSMKVPSLLQNKGNLLKIGNKETIAGSTLTEAKGVPSFTNAKWAQPKHSNNFSKIGQEVLGVETIDDAVALLKDGTMKSNALPIDYVIRNNEVFILNTRSSVALTKAGIDRTQWKWVNRTGQNDFEKRLTNQLEGSNGYTEVINSATKEVTKNQ